MCKKSVNQYKRNEISKTNVPVYKDNIKEQRPSLPVPSSQLLPGKARIFFFFCCFRAGFLPGSFFSA